MSPEVIAIILFGILGLLILALILHVIKDVRAARNKKNDTDI